MSCPAVEILLEIRDRLRNLDTLEERRAKDRERQKTCRAKSACHVTENCHVTKEEEKGKENFPPAPPIEKRAKEEENDYHDNRVRVREGSKRCSQHPTLDEVVAFAKEIGSDVDPAYFWRYYNSNHRRWPKNWQDRLRNWTVNDIPRGRIAPVAEATSASLPVVVDWTLCAERCANCRGNGCACGIVIPPSCEHAPRPPEECVKYHRREE